MEATRTSGRIWASMLCLLGALFCAFARAELHLEASLEKDAFHASSETRLYVSVQNTGSTAAEALKLSAGSDALAQADRLEPGGQLEYDLPLPITDGALRLGYVSVTLTYEEAGEAQIEQKLCYVRLLPDKVEGRLVCALPDSCFFEGEDVEVSYILFNSGETGMQNARITMQPGGAVSDAMYVAAGSFVRFSAPVPYERLYEVSAHAACESAISAAPYEFDARIGDIPGYREDIRLSAIADKSVPAGQSAHVTCSVENAGSCAYSGLRLNEAVYGRVDGLPAALLPGDFVAVSFTLPSVDQDTNLLLTLSMLRQDGQEVTFEAQPLTIIAEKADGPAGLQLQCEESEKGILLTLTALGQDAKKIEIGESRTGQTRSVEILKAGDSVMLPFDAPEDAEYVFTAKSADGLEAKTSLQREGVYTGESESALERGVYALIGARSLLVWMLVACGALCALLITLVLRGDRRGASGQDKEKAA